MLITIIILGKATSYINFRSKIRLIHWILRFGVHDILWNAWAIFRNSCLNISRICHSTVIFINTSAKPNVLEHAWHIRNGWASFHKPYSYTLEKQHIQCQHPIRRNSIPLKRRKMVSFHNKCVYSKHICCDKNNNMANTLNIFNIGKYYLTATTTFLLDTQGFGIHNKR